MIKCRKTLSLTLYISQRYIGRTSRRKHGCAGKNRSFARDPRHAHPQNCGSRAGSWVWHLAAHSADFEESSPSSARLALSGSPAIRKAGLARSRLGRIGERASGEVLSIVRQRTKQLATEEATWSRMSEAIALVL